MLDHEYKTMRSVEDKYWWYAVLRRQTCLELGQLAKERSQLSVVDAGCGTGGTLEAIQRELPNARLKGFDVSPLALQHTRSRGFTDVFEASIHRIPLPDCSQDAIVSLDVLYHEDVDQDQAMQEFGRVLLPGGHLIMNLPAFECLRGRHDRAVSGARRYTRAGLASLHSKHGFAIERIFCWNAWLFPAVWSWRQMSKRLPSAQTDSARSDLVLPPRWVNGFVAKIAGLDAQICRILASPIGTSVFSVARALKTP